MSFRVYDKKKKKFTTDNIFLNQDGELVEPKKSLFGNKMTFVDQNRYVYQKSTELQDKNGTGVYVGDYLEAEVSEDKTVQGLVTYAEEIAGYVILCFENGEYFTLSNQVCDRIQVIGNVFDDIKKG